MKTYILGNHKKIPFFFILKIEQVWKFSQDALFIQVSKFI